MNNLDLVRKQLQEQLPLIEHMGIVIDSWDGEVVTVGAPLAPNLNVHGTAFGGSLFSIGAMTGWSAVLLTFLDAGYSPNVWLAKSSIEFMKPVRGRIYAQANISPKIRQQMLVTYESSGRVNVDLDVLIPENGMDAVRIFTQFAVKK